MAEHRRLAAEAMRRILIDRARDKRRLKRGGGRTRLDLDDLAVVDDASDDDLLALERLARESPPAPNWSGCASSRT